MTSSGKAILRIGESGLVERRWAFGPRGRLPLTETFCFSANGLIENYSHANEASWRLNDGLLEILRLNGDVMWRATEISLDGDRLTISLNTPVNAVTHFVLSDRGSRHLHHETGGRLLGAADFLFPKDLQVTPPQVGKVLLIGSCLTALYYQEFKKYYPDVGFDYIVYNYAGSLPASPPSPQSTYDFQYIQIPLRSVVTDRVIWASRFNNPDFPEMVLADGYSVIDAMLSSALTYNTETGLLSFVSNFIVPQMSPAISMTARHTKFDLNYIVRKLNSYLAERAASYRNVHVLDADAVASSIGKRYILDDTVYFNSHNSVISHEPADFGPHARIEPMLPVSELYGSQRREFLTAIYDQMIGALQTIRQVDQVKAVVLDLDNTLWRGQVAEHYRPDQESWPKTDGWPLGIWEAIHVLRARGIMVAICSKNDLATIEAAWANVVQPKFLNLSDFVSVKINWRPKAENILEICNEFNIKPKSIVFVDDNPVERESVKAQIPDVRVIGSDPYSVRRILLWAAETNITQLTEESARRESMIRSQIVREENRATLSRAEFLATLGSTVTFVQILSDNAPEFPRVIELINKTNQFNTSGKRWTHAEAVDFIARNGLILAFRVNDRFADYGLVGVILAQESSIIQFVMSCRVLGMDVEQTAMAYTVATIRHRTQCDSISAFLQETPDNAPSRAVFRDSGFAEIECINGRHLYCLKAAQECLTPAHVTLEHA